MMLSHAAVLAASLPGSESRVQWIAAGVIVLACLVIYGGMDLLRFSLVRTRAVASVCFRESIRRRVLWLTPLAILGVVLVSQFLRPLDEQDNIRQVTKFCMFASGLLVTVGSVIMACTNLPKEIENRVIFTVVTKPTTRLEILLGKIIGFSAVSAVILIIMGVFTWGYLHYRQYIILGDIRSELQVADSSREPAAQKTLEYYRDNGLLDARFQADPVDVQVVSTYTRADDPVRWMGGESEEIAYIPFRIDPQVLAAMPATGGVLAAELHIPWQQQRELTADELKTVTGLGEAVGIKTDGNVGMGPLLADATGQAANVAKLIPAMVKVGLASANFEPLIDRNFPVPMGPFPLPNGGKDSVPVSFPAEGASKALRSGTFYVEVQGVSPAMRYALSADSVQLLVPTADPLKPTIVKSARFDSSRATTIVLHGRNGSNGQQVRGDAGGNGPVGFFAFRGATMPLSSRGKASFELRTGIERSVELAQEQSQSTMVEVRVANAASGKVSDAVLQPIEPRRTAHIELPQEFTAGGDFDVLIRCLTPQHWVGLRASSLHMSSPDMGFGFNMVKGYVILWLFSVLVVTVAIFCSTFLSWPIAIVLTLMILLGNWGVMQVGDMMNPGAGRQVVGDLFAGAAPAVAETLNRSVEGLTSLVKNISLFFPDISPFGSMEEIERGSWITWPRMMEPLRVLAIFGLPILGLSYVFFRNKEVAP